MISREKLLEAAIRVFTESGFRGATTRRIAEEAGVNEVTLFRLFKSKTALINEAAKLHARLRLENALPLEPHDPRHELTEWCAAQLAFLQKSRALIRKCMAELEEHPEMGDCMRHGPASSHTQVRRYARALANQTGTAISDDLVDVACTMLMGALFADAMGREFMPQMYPRPVGRAPARYALMFLRALGIADVKHASANGNGHGPHRPHRAHRTRRVARP
jgi:AcrR family transcriptional regulator